MDTQAGTDEKELETARETLALEENWKYGSDPITGD